MLLSICGENLGTILSAAKTIDDHELYWYDVSKTEVSLEHTGNIPKILGDSLGIDCVRALAAITLDFRDSMLDAIEELLESGVVGSSLLGPERGVSCYDIAGWVIHDHVDSQADDLFQLSGDSVHLPEKVLDLSGAELSRPGFEGVGLELEGGFEVAAFPEESFLGTISGHGCDGLWFCLLVWFQCSCDFSSSG